MEGTANMHTTTTNERDGQQPSNAAYPSNSMVHNNPSMNTIAPNEAPAGINDQPLPNYFISIAPSFKMDGSKTGPLLPEGIPQPQFHCLLSAEAFKLYRQFYINASPRQDGELLKDFNDRIVRVKKHLGLEMFMEPRNMRGLKDFGGCKKLFDLACNVRIRETEDECKKHADRLKNDPDYRDRWNQRKDEVYANNLAKLTGGYEKLKAELKRDYPQLPEFPQPQPPARFGDRLYHWRERGTRIQPLFGDESCGWKPDSRTDNHTIRKMADLRLIATNGTYCKDCVRTRCYKKCSIPAGGKCEKCIKNNTECVPYPIWVRDPDQNQPFPPTPTTRKYAKRASKRKLSDSNQPEMRPKRQQMATELQNPFQPPEFSSTPNPTPLSLQQNQPQDMLFSTSSGGGSQNMYTDRAGQPNPMFQDIQQLVQSKSRHAENMDVRYSHSDPNVLYALPSCAGKSSVQNGISHNESGYQITYSDQSGYFQQSPGNFIHTNNVEWFHHYDFQQHQNEPRQVGQWSAPTIPAPLPAPAAPNDMIQHQNANLGSEFDFPPNQNSVTGNANMNWPAMAHSRLGRPNTVPGQSSDNFRYVPEFAEQYGAHARETIPSGLAIGGQLQMIVSSSSNTPRPPVGVHYQNEGGSSVLETPSQVFTSGDERLAISELDQNSLSSTGEGYPDDAFPGFWDW